MGRGGLIQEGFEFYDYVSCDDSLTSREIQTEDNIIATAIEKRHEMIQDEPEDIERNGQEIREPPTSSQAIEMVERLQSYVERHDDDEEGKLLKNLLPLESFIQGKMLCKEKQTVITDFFTKSI